MTTPNQPAPDGAVTVGGNQFRFGQLVDEKRAREQFEIEAPGNLAEAMDLLPVLLGQLPNDAMKPWAKWLNLDDEVAAAGGIVQALIDALTDNPLTKVIQTVAETIDGMVRGLVGWIETGFTPAQVEAAAKDVANTVADLRAIVTALAASKGFAGVAKVIDFTGMADSSTLGSEWTQTYFSGSGTGTFGISGGRARWLGSASERWCSARYNTETKGDYQKIGVAFSTKPSRNIFGGSKSVNRIMGRVSPDQNTFVAVDFTADGFTLGCQVAGSWTTWYTRSWSLFDPWEFKAGAAYWLECGTTGGSRIFRVWENNTIIATHVESSAGSMIGPTFRGVGVGVKAFNDTAIPAQIASIAFFDNQAALKMGSGWRITRTGGSSVTVSSGDNSFPSNWFNTPDYITDDLAYDTTNNKITVAATGWYQINVNQYGDNAIVGEYSLHALLIVNGGVAQRGPLVHWNGRNKGIAGSFIVYLMEGDNVKPGYSSSNTIINNLPVGEPTGTFSYWSGVYLGTNKKLPTTT